MSLKVFFCCSMVLLLAVGVICPKITSETTQWTLSGLMPQFGANNVGDEPLTSLLEICGSRLTFNLGADYPNSQSQHHSTTRQDLSLEGTHPSQRIHSSHHLNPKCPAKQESPQNIHLCLSCTDVGLMQTGADSHRHSVYCHCQLNALYWVADVDLG